MSHMTLVDKGNVHQINASVDIKLLAKFHKAERNGSTRSENQLKLWFRQVF